MLRKSKDGFTMIEVLLAVSLMGIALIPIMELMPGIYRVDQEMIRENTMSFLAQEKLEDIKGKLIDDFSVSINPLSDTFSGEFSGGENYHFIIGSPSNPSNPSQPKDNPDGSRTDLVVVSVQVWYGDAGSYSAATDKIQLETRIARRPNP